MEKPSPWKRFPNFLNLAHRIWGGDFFCMFRMLVVKMDPWGSIGPWPPRDGSLQHTLNDLWMDSFVKQFFVSSKKSLMHHPHADMALSSQPLGFLKGESWCPARCLLHHFDHRTSPNAVSFTTLLTRKRRCHAQKKGSLTCGSHSGRTLKNSFKSAKGGVVASWLEGISRASVEILVQWFWVIIQQLAISTSGVVPRQVTVANEGLVRDPPKIS